MKITHRYLHELDVIWVKHTGIFRGLEKNHSELTRISRLALEYQSRKFLMDTRDLILKQSVVDLYYLGEQLEKLGFKRGYQLAFLHTRDKDLDLFFETTVQNRGHLVRYFDKERDALEWLNQPDAHRVIGVKQHASWLHSPA